MKIPKRDPILTEIVTNTKSHKGFNYAEITYTFDDSAENHTHYECNCSYFDTEPEAIEFINEIA